MNFLEKMREIKTREVHEHGTVVPISKLAHGAKKAKHAFLKALQKKKGVSLIAEFKRASPSKGAINAGAQVKDFAKLYDKYADAISVLTEEKYFAGSLQDIRDARRCTKKPILRKDFIIDEYQVFEARAAGADAILLIAGLVGLQEINRLIRAAHGLGMDALVECFDEEGLGVVLASDAKIFGINNRNLITMDEDFQKTKKFLRMIPAAKRKNLVLVCESSIHSHAQIDALHGKADAALVGTSIMSYPSPEAKLRELTGNTLVKICGTTNVRDALNAVKLGADMIGLNFYEKSPRFVNVNTAKKIADAVRGKAVVCGVFVNERSERVEMIAREVRLDMVQFSGDESAQYVNSFAIPSIKAIHMKGEESVGAAQDFAARMVMLDAFVKGEYGGTGKTFDPKLVDAKALAGKQVVFSGGLNAHNVKAIIKKFRPFMVDVCSGVEDKPCKKSFSKMKAFFKSARAGVAK